MNVGIVLLGTGGGIGGAEKRYMNLFKYLVKNGNENNYYFIIWHTLYDNLNKCGFELDEVPNIIQLSKPKWVQVLRGKGDNSSEKKCARDAQHNRLAHLWASSKSFFSLAYRIYFIVKIKRRLSLDILHGVLDGISPLLPYYFSKRTGTVISYVSSELLGLSSKLIDIPQSFHIALNRAEALDILNSRMKDGLIERGYDILERGHVAPCSFTTYSRIYSYKKKERMVVYSARLIPMKNPLIFIHSIPKTLAQLRDKDVKFIVMGSGVLEEQVRRSVVDLRLQKYVEAYGFVPDPIEILTKSLIFVQLSEVEGHGTQSLLEAMACKNAVIVVDNQGIEEIVSDDVGFRVAFSADEIAEKTAWLLNHPKQAQEMGRRAREKVMQEQTVERYAEYIEKVYERTYTTIR